MTLWLKNNDTNRNVTLCFISSFGIIRYLLSKYDQKVIIKVIMCYFMQDYQLFR